MGSDTTKKPITSKVFIGVLIGIKWNIKIMLRMKKLMLFIITELSNKESLSMKGLITW
jgi:hypothetical protein